MRVCASSVSPAFGGSAETKKARHRRCFKPPCENPWRPQARANLGKPRCMCFAPPMQGKMRTGVERGICAVDRPRRASGAKRKGRPKPPLPIAPRSVQLEIRLRRSPQRARVRCLLAQAKAGVLCGMSRGLPYSRPVSGRQHLFRLAAVVRGELGGTPTAARRYPGRLRITASRAALR
jgi:hypothetical protein